MRNKDYKVTFPWREVVRKMIASLPSQTPPYLTSCRLCWQHTPYLDLATALSKACVTSNLGDFRMLTLEKANRGLPKYQYVENVCI